MLGFGPMQDTNEKPSSQPCQQSQESASIPFTLNAGVQDYRLLRALGGRPVELLLNW